MLAQPILDLFGRDVLAASDDDVLDAAGNPETTIGVQAGFVARVQPAFGVNRGARRLGVVVVALHHVVAAAAQLTALASRTPIARHGIDDFDFELRQHRADRL